jgi:predicted RNase H-like HicB family nuclease
MMAGGAYPPDIPGVGVVANTRAEARDSVRKAIEMHLAGLREDGHLSRAIGAIH